jgi:CRP-like cAMP-binding protein
MDSSVFFPYPTDVPSSATTGFLGYLYEDEVATILSYTQSRRFAVGEPAIHRGETDRSLYVVTRGRFEALVPGSRGVQRARIFEPGDIFGELAFFDKEPRSADVRATEDAEVMMLTPDGFDRLRLAHPRLALLFVLDLGRVLSLRFRDYNRRLAALNEL